ncbi:hypothetical protein HHL19_20075 [Streptomyces sp. R302]|uniref:hypothetical protein n=1 Tax=unclassified Streptomyces TaxID=2593676 RepID=UPI00145C7225|nr:MULTISPECIES: hypothetical protein [unclassified Streptomyces]NML50807.1 hypothetical protein [Streptomyces sp. R301]NML80901.1 hypothetical protein [Streptomyces sp. R302]
MAGEKRDEGAEEVPFGRTKGVLGLIAGVALVAFALLLSFGLGSSQASAERAFQAAVPCGGPSSAGERPEDDCLRVEEATVQKVREETVGKNTTREVDLLGPGPGTERVFFRGSHPVFSVLQPGDRVRATVWRGRVVELSAGTRRQATEAAPIGDSGETTVVAIVVSCVGVAMLGYGWWVFGLGRRSRTRTFWAALGLAALTLGTVVATAGP